MIYCSKAYKMEKVKLEAEKERQNFVETDSEGFTVLTTKIIDLVNGFFFWFLMA